MSHSCTPLRRPGPLMYIHSRGHAHAWSTRVLVALAILLAPSLSFAAYPVCTVRQQASLDFGTVSGSGARDASAYLRVECSGDTNTLVSTALFRVCLFIGEGSPAGIAPRRMYNGTDAYMNYDLYSDSSRTLMIGTPGSNHPLHSATFGIAPRTTYYHDFPIHGRVRAGQNLPATSAYKGLPTNSMVRYSYGYVYTPTESECRAGTPGHFGGAGIANYTWSGIHARVANTCRISTATDMDFGTAGGLAAALEQTSTIRFKCPTNTAWHVTLNDGAYAQAGRRFMNAGGKRLGYELYRDPALLERWGNTRATGVSGIGTNVEQSLTVHGRVFSDPAASPGSYRDTITVTLTF